MKTPVCQQVLRVEGVISTPSLYGIAVCHTGPGGSWRVDTEVICGAVLQANQSPKCTPYSSNLTVETYSYTEHRHERCRKHDPIRLSIGSPLILESVLLCETRFKQRLNK